MRGFVPNPRFLDELKADPGVHAALRAPAEQAASAAEAAAPSKMAPGFYVEDTPDGVRVGTTNPFFHLTEWGSRNNPPTAPLRRAVRATGARLEETGP